MPLIALPGDPVAAFVGFELFVRPVVRRLMGHADVYGPRRNVTLTEDVQGFPGVTTMVPVLVEEQAATPVGAGVPALARANALAVVSADRISLRRGDTVTAVFLEHS